MDGQYLGNQISREGTFYELIGENEVIATGAGLQQYPIAAAARIQVRAGDIVGWTYETVNGIIDYDNSAPAPTVLIAWNGATWGSGPEAFDLAVGDRLAFPSGTRGGIDNRVYSIEANFVAVPEASTLLLLGFGLAGLAWRLRVGL